MSERSRDRRVSEDPDTMVAQLLEQFHSTNSRTTPANNSKGSKTAFLSVDQSTRSTKSAESSFEIVVPTIENPEDYEHLPGHFEVHCILAVDMHEPKFIVRLASGERITVSEQ
jgi:hypothetical protein